MKDIETLRQEAEAARAAFEAAQAEARRGVAAQLAELTASLDKQFQEAKKLAESVDMVFYFSSGYEEFGCVEKQDWSSSSLDC